MMPKPKPMRMPDTAKMGVEGMAAVRRVLMVFSRLA
jgi:hypothetical protein